MMYKEDMRMTLTQEKNNYFKNNNEKIKDYADL